MNSEEDASLAQLLRTAWGGQGAAGGGGDKGRGLGHNWSPRLSIQWHQVLMLHTATTVTDQGPCATTKLDLLLGCVGSPWPGPPLILHSCVGGKGTRSPAGKNCVCATNKSLLPKIRLLGCTLCWLQQNVFPQHFASSAVFIRNSLWTVKRSLLSPLPSLDSANIFIRGAIKNVHIEHSLLM